MRICIPEKYCLIIILFIIGGFSLLNPSQVHAANRPNVVTDEFSLYLHNLFHDGDQSASFPYNEEKITQTHIDETDQVSGSTYTIAIGSSDVLLLSVTLDEQLDSVIQDDFYKHSMLSVTNPEGEDFVLALSENVILDSFQPGEYVVRVVYEEEVQYNIKVLSITDPFLGDLSIIGPRFDFTKYQEACLEYIENGGNIVIYRNESASSYFEVLETNVPIPVEDDPLRRNILLNTYFDKDDEVVSVSSNMESTTISELQGVSVALLVKVNEQSGNVIFLSPTIFNLESNDIASIMRKDIQSYVERPVMSEDSDLNILLYVLVGSLLLKFLLLRGPILNIVVKNTGQERPGTLTRITHYVLWGLLIIDSIVAILFLTEAWAAFQQSSSTSKILSFFTFLFPNLGRSFDTYLVVMLLIFLNLAIVLLSVFRRIIGVPYRYYHTLKESILSRIPKESSIRTILYVLLVGVCSVFVFTLTFQPSTVFQFISFLLFIFVVFLISELLVDKGWNDGLDNRIILLSTIPIVLPALLFGAQMLNSVFSIVSVGSEYHIDLSTDILRGHVDYILHEDELNMTIVSDRKGSNADIAISQKLQSDTSIYMTYKNPSRLGKVSRHLFFNNALPAFPYSYKIEDHYLYSKSELEIDDSLMQTIERAFPQGARVGLDLSLGNDVIDYLPQRADNTQEYSYPLNILGDFMFYTVIEDTLDVTLYYKDRNKYIGGEDFTITIENEHGVVRIMHINDDSVPLYEKSTTNTVQILEENLPSGIYRVKIMINDAQPTISKTYPDIQFHSVDINSSKFLFRSYGEPRLSFIGDVDVYTIPADSIIDKVDLFGETNFISYQPEVYYNASSTNNSNDIINIQIEDCEMCAIRTQYSLYSPTEDSFFKPYAHTFSDISEQADLILTGSNLVISKIDENWYNSTLTLEDESIDFNTNIIFDFAYLSMQNYRYTVEEVIVKIEN